MNIAEALQDATVRLRPVQDIARLDAEVLLAHVLGRDRTYLHTWPERELCAEELARFEALLQRRLKGEPVAHLTGTRAFWTLDLQVGPATLIPRPETELLVEAALARLPGSGDCRILDLGTGSGAIALALASECPGCRVEAVERSEAALAVARENAVRLGLDNVTFHAGDWFEPLADERFDLILSNPPYIPRHDPHLEQGDVRFEPRNALISGEDGLDDIRHLIAMAPAHLLPGGWLLLEHGYDQGEAVSALFEAQGFIEVEELRDLQGHGRVALGRRA